MPYIAVLKFAQCKIDRTCAFSPVVSSRPHLMGSNGRGVHSSPAVHVAFLQHIRAAAGHAMDTGPLVAVDVGVWVRMLGAAVLTDLGLALEVLADSAASLEGPAGSEELLHRHLGLHGGGVEGGLVLDALVDRDRGVDHRGLDHFPLDHGHDLLVHVVVDMLALDGAYVHLLVGGGEDGGCGTQLRRLEDGRDQYCGRQWKQIGENTSSSSFRLISASFP